MDKIFDSIVAVIATFFTYILGGWDIALIVLATFMALDYLTGVIYAFIAKTIDSGTGFKGLLKKCTIIIVVVVAVLLDRMLNTGSWVFRTLVCYFYIANEGISLLENVSKIGIPIPIKLKAALEQLNKDKTL